ncbi:enoyl-CoA hydratase-related protein [Urechidicola sp. KH5]
MDFKNIVVTNNDAICTITITRPNQLNALNITTILELHQALADADADKQTRAIVITGSGTRAFVAGADIKEFAHFDEEQGRTLSKNGHDLLFDFVENLKTPVIAAINGFALGGGLELAMSAHFRVASDNAKMGLPEVSLGVIPGYGGTQRLTQLVGKGRAMELILTANMLTAIEAKECGLVNHVVPQEELLPLAHKLASKIATNSSTAVAMAIATVNAQANKKMNGFETEIENFGKCFDTKDFAEGTTAFLEKRKPKF